MAVFSFDIHDPAAGFGADRVFPKIQDGIEADVGFMHYFCWNDDRVKVIPVGGGVDSYLFHMKIPEREVWYLRWLTIALDNQVLNNAAWRIITPGYAWSTGSPIYVPSTDSQLITEIKSGVVGSAWGDNRDELNHRAIFGGEFLEFIGFFGSAVNEDHIKITIQTIRTWLPDKLQRQHERRDQSADDQILKSQLSRVNRTSFGT